MALVTVKINGFPHTVGCQDGQEAHLQAMAAEVERRVQGLLGSGAGRDPAGGGETRLLALASLMLADELHDMRVELDQMRRALSQKPREVVREVVVEVQRDVPMPDSVYAEKLESLARRAEDIAAGLERA